MRGLSHCDYRNWIMPWRVGNYKSVIVLTVRSDRGPLARAIAAILEGSRLGLQHFPLVEEIPDLPHEALMLVNDVLGVLMLRVKARRRHLFLELLDRSLAFANPRFECGDAIEQSLEGLVASAAVGYLL